MAKSTTLQPIQTDVWVKASWETFTAITAIPDYQTSRAYYDQDCMRIEIAPLGSAHGQDNSLISAVVTLYGLAKNLPIKELINTSFRRTGVRECQPDLAYYIGASSQPLPRDNAPIDVDRVGAPTLVVEIGATSFSDDLGNKRLLYEQFGVSEYWVVNTAAQEVVAFSIADGRSGRIAVSEVLPDLAIATIDQALQRSATADTSTIASWLLQSFGEL